MRSLLRLSERVLASRPGNRRCVICKNFVARFLPFQGGWRRAPSLIRDLEVVGSDLDNFECPRCGSHDRERHLILYLGEIGLLRALMDKVVVHFAPEDHLSKIVMSTGPRLYVPCDLFRDGPGILKEDMMDMSFGDESVDVLIANHVLEHVADDRAALAEIRRVLVPGGVAILQTPFSPVLFRTWEDPGIDTPLRRASAYGQDDHVRLYGRDIVERIAACGFRPDIRRHADVLRGVDAKRAGVNAEEPLMMFVRL